MADNALPPTPEIGSVISISSPSGNSLQSKNRPLIKKL